MDGLFLNQKTNKNIRISYSLKYKHSKKKYLQKKKKKMIMQYEINIPRSSINEKPNSMSVSYALYGVYFCKEKLMLSC